MFNPIEKIKVARQRKIDKAEDKADAERNMRIFGSSYKLINKEFIGEDINLSGIDKLINCKFINCNVKFNRTRWFMDEFADCIFENCNIEVKGEKFHLGEFDSEIPCKFINTRVDFKEVTRNDLLHFLYGGYKVLTESFEGHSKIIKECFDSCTFGGKTADEFIKDLENGLYNYDKYDEDLIKSGINYLDDSPEIKKQYKKIIK